MIKIRLTVLEEIAFYITGQGSPSSLAGYHLHLYKVPAGQPDPAVNAGQFTEPTDTGYAAVTVSPGDWSSGGSGDDYFRYASVQYTFNFAGGTGETVVGYYLTQASGDWVWADLLPGGSFTIPGGGGPLVLALKMEGRDASFE